MIPALTATALFAQGPGGFGSAPGNPGPGYRGMMPAPQGPDVMGPRGMRGQGMGMRGRGMGDREFELGRLLGDPSVRQQLGVSADQAAKIRQQESDIRKTEIRNRADLQIKRLDLNDLLSAEKPDRTAIDSKLQEIGAAQIALEKSAIDYRLNMREALTPVQRQRLEQMMAQRRQPMAPAPGSNPAPRGLQGGARGGRGTPPTPNPPGQPPPNR